MNIRKMYKGGKARAVTFSFDDGHAQDMRVMKLFDRYGLKCTFNLMGGRCNNSCFVINYKNGELCLWDGSDELKECYKNYEVASHSLTHAHFTKLTDEELEIQVASDIKALGEAFGREIKGFASPYGEYDERLAPLLKKYDIRYHRTTHRCYDYSLPEDFLYWNPSPHISYYTTNGGQKFLEDFKTTDKELACLYIWGHSSEFTNMDTYCAKDWGNIRENRWEFFEENVCKKVAFDENVWYATNIEICDYVTAMRSAEISDKYIANNSDIDLFFLADGKPITVPSHSKVQL